MSSGFGLPPGPLNYTGENVSIIPLKQFNHQPTTSDKKYRVGQFVILGASPSTGVQGELWYLSHFSSGDPQWSQISVGPTVLEEFVVSSGTSPVVADGSGQITLTDGNGVAMTGGTNEITFDMSTPFTGDFVFTGRLTAEFFETEATDAGATLTGNSLIADGTDSNIDVVITPKGTGFISSTKAASGQWLAFNDGTDAFGYYNNAGSPEGVVTASIGSWCSDTTNGVLYVKNTGDATNTGWVEVDTGTGDVVGPGSSTDNAIVRYDGTTGKLVQNSSAILGDSGDIALTRSASGQWLGFDDGTDTFGYYNNAGSPEGVVTASIGSWCSDTTNGEIYVKQTGDATNTGWIQLDSGDEFNWTEVTVTGPTAMTVNTGYIANNAGANVDLTLPSTAALGSVIRVSGKGAGGFQIQQNAGQTVHFAGSDTTTGVGGSITSTITYNAIELLCTTADTDFVVLSSIGNFTIV